jgi:hypothetical protein
VYSYEHRNGQIENASGSVMIGSGHMAGKGSLLVVFVAWSLLVLLPLARTRARRGE